MTRGVKMRSERCSHKQTSQTHRGVSEESENKFSGFFFFFGLRFVNRTLYGTEHLAKAWFMQQDLI